jgi:hypothetical protein
MTQISGWKQRSTNAAQPRYRIGLSASRLPENSQDFLIAEEIPGVRVEVDSMWHTVSQSAGFYREHLSSAVFRP